MNKALSNELFMEPTAEYRGAPFWAWNCQLSEEELLWQIDKLREMGFGGFHMHPRDGMATEYLTKNFMKLIEACCDKARKEQMLAYLYDEDKYPSGFAGGYVTADPRYRSRSLLFTPFDKPVAPNSNYCYVEDGGIGNDTELELPQEEAIEKGAHYFIAAYDVQLDEEGLLVSCRRIERAAPAQGDKWYAFCTVAAPTAWFNNQTYLDTLNKDAVDAFIRVTHETYKKCLGESFGNGIPSIFTDEPQFSFKEPLTFARDKKPVYLTWTPTLPETYKAVYGEDLLEKLPELVWDLAGHEPSKTRYRYHDHICERFACTYVDNIGSWCEKNNLLLTGHLMEEKSLFAQTSMVGEVMRVYRGFGIPGVDVLCANYEFATVKQCQSVKRQYGREAMMSELYGVANYDFDFRGFKLQGDWQACLGVTLRVPHLSWVSMKGCAKRDYPASFNYQSPWHREYKQIEDHFARVNTALTRGKPVVKVAVIHPIESFWLHFGPNDTSGRAQSRIQENFTDLTEYLLNGLVDFDFVSESLLPSLHKESREGFCVGEMTYKTVVVPGCVTLRRTTVECLKQFRAQGGRVIFVGERPRYMDLEASAELDELYDDCVHVGFEREAILDALSDVRDISILDHTGYAPRSYLYTMTQDVDARWLFLCRVHPQKPVKTTARQGYFSRGIRTFVCDSPTCETIRLTVRGCWKPILYDTMTGEVQELPYTHSGGNTVISHGVWYHDSLLLKLVPTAVPCLPAAPTVSRTPDAVIDFKGTVPFTLEGDNVCLLDRAAYRLDDGQWQPEEEILRLDTQVRHHLGMPDRLTGFAQPWTIAPEIPRHTLRLRFTVPCDCAVEGVRLALEDRACTRIFLNGKEVSAPSDGYFVDKAISTVLLGTLDKGSNLLELEMPFGTRTNTEWCWLLGDFRVKVEGCCKTLTAARPEIGFGPLAQQGFPFYGGNVRYETEIETAACDLVIRTSLYRGALVKVWVDGRDCGSSFMAPYEIKVPSLRAGKHTVVFQYFGNLHNTFGSMHNCSADTWYGPNHWYSQGNGWMYEYRLKDTGILASPVIYIYNRQGET